MWFFAHTHQWKKRKGSANPARLLFSDKFDFQSNFPHVEQDYRSLGWPFVGKVAPRKLLICKRNPRNYLHCSLFRDCFFSPFFVLFCFFVLFLSFCVCKRFKTTPIVQTKYFFKGVDCFSFLFFQRSSSFFQRSSFVFLSFCVFVCFCLLLSFCVCKRFKTTPKVQKNTFSKEYLFFVFCSGEFQTNVI